MTIAPSGEVGDGANDTLSLRPFRTRRLSDLDGFIGRVWPSPRIPVTIKMTFHVYIVGDSYKPSFPTVTGSPKHRNL